MWHWLSVFISRAMECPNDRIKGWTTLPFDRMFQVSRWTDHTTLSVFNFIYCRLPFDERCLKTYVIHNGMFSVGNMSNAQVSALSESSPSFPEQKQPMFEKLGRWIVSGFKESASSSNDISSTEHSPDTIEKEPSSPVDWNGPHDKSNPKNWHVKLTPHCKFTG